MNTNHDALREALEPCPFCGEPSDLTVHVYGNGDDDAYVQCRECTTCGPDGGDRAGAIAKWNHRALSQPMPEAAAQGWRLTESQRKLVTFSLRMAAMAARQRADYCGQKGPTEHVGPLLDDAKELESIVAMLSASPAAPEGAKHPDDEAVDRFVQAMKEKLASARQKGRGGWQTCSQSDLSQMLRDHVVKGDPRDVANFCMFLWNLGHGIEAKTSVCDFVQVGDFSKHDAAKPEHPQPQAQSALSPDDIHSCGEFCDLPECVAAREAQAQGEPEVVAWTVPGRIVAFNRDFSAYQTKTYTVPLITLQSHREAIAEITRRFEELKRHGVARHVHDEALAQHRAALAECVEQNRQLKKSLLRWRQEAFPGTDQAAVMERDFPAIIQANQVLEGGGK